MSQGDPVGVTSLDMSRLGSCCGLTSETSTQDIQTAPRGVEYQAKVCCLGGAQVVPIEDI